MSNIDKFFERLFLAVGISPLPKGILIIFDEVQFCPKARQAIKSLVKDKRYFYIVTGSLISIKENVKDILIPSKEESIRMNPMDYEEFLWAIKNEFQADVIKEHFLNKERFDSKIHQEILQDYRTYLAVIGMPKVVDTYIKTHDFVAVDKEKRTILKLYEEDLRKIDNKFGTICYLVWKQIPSMLTKHSTRFIVSSTNERIDSILFTNTMEKLIESKMIIVVYRANDPIGGFALTKDISSFKIYYNDVGLFTSIIYANSESDSLDIYQRLVLDNLHTNLMMLFENAFCQTLVINGFEPYYYSWNEIKEGRKKSYEIDFIIFKKGKTIPIEVRPRNISNKTSLEEFNKKFTKKIGEKYIVSSSNLKVVNKLISIPYYMFFALK